MSAILATQLGPLTWVKPEIDFALERVRCSLATYFAQPVQNADALSAALASVREVTGALQIIGMDALGSFSREIDAVLDAMAKQQVTTVSELKDLLDRATTRLEGYLCDLMAGSPENAMCLRPLMDELVRARGGEPVDDRVMFHRNLTIVPPPLASGVMLEGDALRTLVKLQRGHFQRGMLTWLRGSDDGLERMRDALQEIERAQPAAGRRAPWWVASAFVEGLLHGGLATSADTRRAAGKIDRYLAAFSRGLPTSAELVRELLFYLATCEPVTPLVRDVKRLYQLDRRVAASATADVVEIDTTELAPVMRKAHDLVNLAKHAWTGSGLAQWEAAGDFHACLASLGELATDLGYLPMSALIEAMRSVVADLPALDSARKATIILEIAAAIIALEKGMQDCKFMMSDATAEFDAIRERLLAALSGSQTHRHEGGGANSEPSLPQREERELLHVVAREILATLQQVEQSLDACFRGQTPTTSLAQLPGLMRSVTGAFSVLGVESAAQLIDRCTSIVATLDQPERMTTDEETSLLAEGLSSVMLFVQALDHGNQEELRAVETILARFDAQEALLASSSVLDFQTSAGVPQPTQPGELDFDLLEAPPEARMVSCDGEGSVGLRDGEEVTKAELAEILDHYDLSALKDEPEADANALESSEEALVDLGDTTSIQESDASWALSDETEPDAVEVDATAEGVDPEIVSIFIEEANELLDAMGELLSRARAEPNDLGNLTTLRRSYHTLKGSGRMAGLHAIGDAAWTIESLLNQWLDAERPASENLINLTTLGRELFTEWIGDVAQRGQTTVRRIALSEQANRVTQELQEPVAGTTRAAGLNFVDLLPIATLDMTVDVPAVDSAKEVVALGVSTLSAPLFRVFVEEARQNVAALRAGLEVLGPDVDDEARNAVTRAALILGEIARTAGFPDITVVAGVIESAPLGGADAPKNRELLKSAVDTLEALVASVADRNVPELPEDRRAEFIRQAAALKDRGISSLNASMEESLQDPEARICDEKPSVNWPPTESVGPTQSEDQSEVPLRAETTPKSLVDGSDARAEDLLRIGEDVSQVSSTGNTPRGASDRRALKDDIDQQLLPIFLDEVHDLGPLIGEDLRHLRKEPNDAAAFDSLRRVLHTIKGGARMVGAIRLGELVHIMEGRLEGALERGAVSPEVLDLLEGEFDRLTSGFDAVEHGAPEQDSSPDPSEGVDTPPGVTSAQYERSIGSDAAPSFSTHIRVAADTLDRLLDQAGEISISRGRIEAEAQTFKQFVLELTDSVARLSGQLREIEIQAESRLQATQEQATEHNPVFDPLEFDRFTRFQELTRLMAESLHDVTTVQHHLLDSLDEVQAALSADSRLNRGLQDDLMRLRTVTFQNIAERLYRVARQAARETGKKAAFEVVGGQTEVDRGVLERIAAPLEHLVRNAITHGIEAVDHRVGAGKPEAGTIRLVLRQETNDLLISLADDGRGIDHDRIRAKALELGWLSVDAELPAFDLEQMILRPGFSTATEVSELAGRGVGMNVVANEVRALGGSLEIATEKDHGTTFTIRVPLTLAVGKALLVSAAGRRWAILSKLIEQVQEVTESMLSELCARQELEWMGRRYAVFYLPQLLGESVAPAADRSRHYALLMHSGDRRIAVLVDQLVVNQDIVLKKIGPQLAGLPGVSGASVLPNGEVVLVLNPRPLVERAQMSSPRPLDTTTQQVRAAPLVMVVDDSLTVRNVTSRLLVRHGYRVATARDGLDALQQVQETTPDVLLIDIEMPRMDGFELTKNLKAGQRTSRLPIIMITSRLASKHREYARQLGVNVYLGKPFEEDELLAHVGAFATSVAAA